MVASTMPANNCKWLFSFTLHFPIIDMITQHYCTPTPSFIISYTSSKSRITPSSTALTPPMIEALLILQSINYTPSQNQYFIKLQIRRIRLRLSRTFRLNLLPSTLKFRIPTSLKHTSLPCIDPPLGKRIHLWGRTVQRTKIL